MVHPASGSPCRLLAIVALLTLTPTAAAEPHTLAWPDLVPVNQASGSLETQGSAEQVRIEWNDKDVRIPGYIVPLEFDEGQIVTKFLLVPYFGACIHMPPPPPNQTIYAEFESGIALDTIFDPFWIEGRMHTTLVVQDLATAAYSMDIVSVEPYTGD